MSTTLSRIPYQKGVFDNFLLTCKPISLILRFLILDKQYMLSCKIYFMSSMIMTSKRPKQDDLTLVILKLDYQEIFNSSLK